MEADRADSRGCQFAEAAFGSNPTARTPHGPVARREEVCFSRLLREPGSQQTLVPACVYKVCRVCRSICHDPFWEFVSGLVPESILAARPPPVPLHPPREWLPQPDQQQSRIRNKGSLFKAIKSKFRLGTTTDKSDNDTDDRGHQAQATSSPRVTSHPQHSRDSRSSWSDKSFHDEATIRARLQAEKEAEIAQMNEQDEKNRTEERSGCSRKG